MLSLKKPNKTLGDFYVNEFSLAAQNADWYRVLAMMLLINGFVFLSPHVTQILANVSLNTAGTRCKLMLIAWKCDKRRAW